MTFKDFADKKVLGIPALYLAGAFVVILAVVAWKMKPSTDSGPSPDAALSEDAQIDDRGIADGSSPYAGLASSGTVTVVQQPVSQDVEPDTIDTNEDWIREGAEWLVAEKNVSGPAAYTALTKYVEGRDRSYVEAQWVEWVIKEKAFPPDPFTETPQPTLPTPTAPKPAPSYRGYGWYKAPGTLTGAAIAQKYKVSVTQFYTWNPNLPRIPAKGVWVKVRANSNPAAGYKGA